LSAGHGAFDLEAAGPVVGVKVAPGQRLELGLVVHVLATSNGNGNHKGKKETKG
jgi:hypothetical protein